MAGSGVTRHLSTRRVMRLRRLLPLVLLNLSLDLVRLGLQLVTERLQFIGALTLSFRALALRFCEAENTLCLSHEVLDVFLGEHSVPYLSPTGVRTSGPTPVGKVLVGDVLKVCMRRPNS